MNKKSKINEIDDTKSSKSLDRDSRQQSPVSEKVHKYEQVVHKRQNKAKQKSLKMSQVLPKAKSI